jgi:hypothetical protein
MDLTRETAHKPDRVRSPIVLAPRRGFDYIYVGRMVE